MDLAATGLGAKECNNSLQTNLSRLPKQLFTIRMRRTFGIKMLRLATPPPATLRHATPRHATPRHATPRHATPRHATRHTATRYHTPPHTTKQPDATPHAAPHNATARHLPPENAHKNNSVHGLLNPTYQARLRRN